MFNDNNEYFNTLFDLTIRGKFSQVSDQIEIENQKTNTAKMILDDEDSHENFVNVISTLCRSNAENKIELATNIINQVDVAQSFTDQKDHYEILWTLANNRIGAVEILPAMFTAGFNAGAVRHNSNKKSDVFSECVNQFSTVPDTANYKTDCALLALLLRSGQLEGFSQETTQKVAAKLEDEDASLLYDAIKNRSGNFSFSDRKLQDIAKLSAPSQEIKTKPSATPLNSLNKGKVVPLADSAENSESKIKGNAGHCSIS